MRSYISWSQLDTLQDCGEKYRQRYVLPQPAERVPKGFFIGGNAVHAAIEEAESTGQWANTEALEPGGDIHLFFMADLAQRTLEAGGDEAVEWGGRKSREFPGGEDQSWWKFNGPAMLRRYASDRRSDQDKGLGVPETEVKVSARRGDGKSVLGYIDQLFPDRVRDYKTGSWSGAAAPPLQLALYEWVLRESDHEPRHIGEYVYLRQADATRRVYQVDLDVWVPLVPMLLDQMEQTLAGEVFTYSPGRHCIWCDVAPGCEVGRRLGGNDGNGLGGPQAADS